MYQIGDIVRIKDKFWECKATIPLGINDTMRSMQGEVHEIRLTPVDGRRTRYRLKVDEEPGTLWDQSHDWVWDENWLEFATEIKDVYTEELDSIFMGD